MAEPGAELFLLEAWVADNPGSRMFLRLARAYRDQDRLEEAAEVLQRGLVMHPGMVEARHLLAQVLEARGDAAGAEAQLTAAARELARHAGVFRDLGALWQREGRHQEAETARELGESLAKGLELGEAPGVETATLAEIYASQGHAAKAADIYRRLLAEKPDSRAARRLAELEAAGEAAEPAVPRPGAEGGPSRRRRVREGMLRRLEGLQRAARARAAG
jgi:tetratricopeptide (TPR) repeat protein